MDAKTESFARILKIMNELREQCPWDKKQTMETLRLLTVEEVYELSDAILQGDPKSISEELGDLLLHVVFYAKIGEEQGNFDIASVINHLCDKLTARHPHIYGDTKVNDAEDVKQNWEKLKMKEGRKSVLGGVPQSLPALIKAYRVQDKAAQVNFQWDNMADVWKKVEEEIAELKREVEQGEIAQQKIEEEFGDVMFALVNYSRYLNVDPEAALERTNLKFIRRFKYIEEQAAAQQKALQDMSLTEMDELWNRAKAMGL